jgi:Ni,Fe-hydrogenase maturation factor
MRVIGCEPAVLESEEGAMGLSEKVQVAVMPAIEMIESLIRNIFDGTENAVATIDSQV